MESAFISRSSRSESDPLSDVLSLLKPRGYMSGGIDAGGDWSLFFERSNGFMCFAVVSGHCWLAIEGTGEVKRLDTGEFVVLPHGPAFRLASDLAISPVDILSAVTEPLNGRIISWQGGGACLGLTAFFAFAGEHANILSSLLPPVFYVRSPSDRIAMRWYLDRMMSVLQEPQPGRVLLAEYLAQSLLIEILRLQTKNDTSEGIGWLYALGDKQIGAAITAMHDHPGQRWTVQKLADCANMSRSAFSLRFKDKVRMAVMEYLTRWRMLLAGDQLMNSNNSVSDIALSLGYESESAFGFAFKREMGFSPRQYCRARSSALDDSNALG